MENSNNTEKKNDLYFLTLYKKQRKHLKYIEISSL